MSQFPAFRTEQQGGPFIRGLGTQLRVIGALIMRELHTRYGRDNIGYLWLILEPMTLAAAVALLHGSEHSTMFGTDMPTVPFTILGYTIFIIFRSIFGRSAGALESNTPLLYHRVVTIFDILLSRAILEFAGIIAALTILLLTAVSLGLGDLPYRPLHLLNGVVQMTWFAFATGMLVCSLTYHSKVAERLIHPITYILMPISGAFYTLHWLPEPYKSLMSYFPMTLIFEEARYGLFETAKNDFVDMPYVLGWNLFLTLCGMLAIKITRRHVHLS